MSLARFLNINLRSELTPIELILLRDGCSAPSKNNRIASLRSPDHRHALETRASRNHRASRTQCQACLSIVEAQPMLHEVNPRHSLREVFPHTPMWAQFIDRFGFAAGGCRFGHRLTAFHRLGIGMACRSDTQTRRRQNPRIRLFGHYRFALHLTAAMRVLNTFGYVSLFYGGCVSE